MSFQVVVKGAKELERAFEDVQTKVDPATAKALRGIARPVKSQIEDLAAEAIGGGPWSLARVGRKKVGVYIVEKQRSRAAAERKRPNLASLLMTRAYLPGLKRNEHLIEAGLTKVLDDLCRSVD